MGIEQQKAIIAWLTKHRPDAIPHIQQVFDNAHDERIKPVLFAMALAFESGRMLQSLNPDVPYDRVLDGSFEVKYDIT